MKFSLRAVVYNEKPRLREQEWGFLRSNEDADVRLPEELDALAEMIAKNVHEV